jgi:hypothetical protein
LECRQTERLDITERERLVQETDRADSVESAREPTKLLVLARDAASVRSTVSFLNRRDIRCEMVPSLNDVVDRLSNKEANMVLLSINFPHPRIEMIPLLLSQSFGVETIVFAEKTDRKSSQMLTSSKAKHVIMGRISGPVVAMRVRKIEKDLESALEGGENGRHGEKSDDGTAKDPQEKDDAILLKGRGGPSEEAMARLMKTLNDVKGSPVATAGGDAEENSGFQPIVGSGAPSTTSGLAPSQDRTCLGYDSESDNAPRAQESEIYIQKGIRGSGGESFSEQEGMLGRSAAFSPRMTNADVKDALTNGRIAKIEKPRGSYSSRRRGRRKSSFYDQFYDETPARKENLPESAATPAWKGLDARAKDAIAEAAHDRAARQTTNTPATSQAGPEGLDKESRNDDAFNAGADSGRSFELGVGADPVSSTSNQELDSIIKKCSREALAKVCTLPTAEQAAALPAFRFAAILAINSPALRGYAVIGIPATRRYIGVLLAEVETEFITRLSKCGFPLERHQYHLIHIDDMALARITIARASFVWRSQGADAEIAMSFCDGPNLIPAIEPHVGDMNRIPLRDLFSGAKVTFDVYLYFPINKKYLRYLRKGSSLTTSQADTLEQKEVTHFFLQKKDTEEYRKFFATQSLSQSPTK